MNACRLLLPAALAVVLTPVLAQASGADTLERRPDRGVSVRVAPTAPGGQEMKVSARDAQGMEHELRMESKDGKLIVHGEPDPSRPWLGVLLSDPSELQALGSDLPTKERRWTVTAVGAGSPAEDAGLQRGDIITGIEGRDVLTDGPGMLKGLAPGDRITLTYERDGSPMKANIKLVSHPGTVEFENAEGIGTFDVAGGMLGSLQGLEALKSLKDLRMLPCPSGTKPEDCPKGMLALAALGGPRLGVSVEPMSEQLAKYFGAPEGHGLLVKDVVPGSPAERAGIQAGDVILEVADREIHAAGDIRAALEGREEGDTVSVDLLRRGKQVSLDVKVEMPKTDGMLRLPLMQQRERLAQAGAALERARETFASHETKRSIEEALASAHEALASEEVQREMHEALAKAQVELERAQAEMPRSLEAQEQAQEELRRALEIQADELGRELEAQEKGRAMAAPEPIDM